ncbi:MAG: hypothetical protein R3F21_21770 [Myxococcota bacterium]
MSDHEHVEPENPPADAFATRLFVVSMVGILSFITIVFVFVI